MMKILEFSSGKIIDTEQLAVSDCNNNYKKNKNHNNDGGSNKNHKKKKKIRSRISKGNLLILLSI